MAEPHAHSQPIQTYGPAPHNRNIWPHNSRATVFCLRFWPILLFALVPAVYPLLRSYEKQDQKQVGWRTSKNTSMNELSKPRGFGSGYSKTNDDVKRCHHCGSDQHLVRECEKAKGNQG